MKNKEKIIETYDVDDYEILTDTGWEDITHIHKTVPFSVWRLETEDFFLECADEHIVIDQFGNQVFVEDLIVGDIIKTIKGNQQVKNVFKMDKPEQHMYDITVGSENHTFYSNGILSHNTTTITIYALWLVCFQADKRITIVANKESTAKEIFARIKMAYEQLPIYLKPNIKSWRNNKMILGNDSEISVSTTSSSGPRGTTSNLLIIDEMAHCPNELMKELWKSAIPIISSMKKSQIVVISTPNGTENKFYELYKDAQKEDGEWHLEVVNYWDVPGRDDEWKRKTMSMMGSKDDFEQEYCNVFHDPNKKVVDEEYLKHLRDTCPEPVLVLEEGAYKIFQLPNPDSFYVIGVDVGEGIGRSNTVAQVLDMSNLQNIQQVAIFASNSVNPYHFGTRLMGILQDWGRPPVLIENNNNGQQVLDVICHTHNYENVVTYSTDGMSAQYNKANRFGIHSHTNTKYKGTTNFRYWVDSLKAVKINDIDTVLEIGNFVRLPNFTFSKKNEKDLDDRVFGLIWGLFVLEPSLVIKYFSVLENDDQGRPMRIVPTTDNRDLIEKSPLLIGGGSYSIAKKPLHVATFSHVGSIDPNNGVDMHFDFDDRAELLSWLHKDDIDRIPLLDLNDSKDKSSISTFQPIVLF